MESSPRLGLRTMYVPLTKGLIYHSMCPVLWYRDGKVLCTQLCPTRGLASILIIFHILILLSGPLIDYPTHTHTHTHTHANPTLAYIP